MFTYYQFSTTAVTKKHLASKSEYFLWCSGLSARVLKSQKLNWWVRPVWRWMLWLTHFCHNQKKHETERKTKALKDNVPLLKGWKSMSHALSVQIWNQKTTVYQMKCHNTKQLSRRMLDMRHGMKQSVIDDTKLMSFANVTVHVFV